MILAAAMPSSGAVHTITEISGVGWYNSVAVTRPPKPHVLIRSRRCDPNNWNKVGLTVDLTSQKR
jgi:hypothetical protein